MSPRFGFRLRTDRPSAAFERMMEAIRTKDRLFLAVVVPLGLLAAYAYFWRAGAVRRVGELERECASLVAADDFPSELAVAERRLAEAKEALAAERKIPLPAAKVRADAAEDVAARERAVREVFVRAGLVVTGSSSVEPADAAAGAVLSKTGCRPSPVCRRYEIEGTYPQLSAALAAFAAREMAVIPDRIEMPRPGRWTVALWM